MVAGGDEGTILGMFIETQSTILTQNNN